MSHLKYWVDVDVRNKQVLHVFKISLKGEAGKGAMKVNRYQPLAGIIRFVRAENLSVERFGVSHMRDFLINKHDKKVPSLINFLNITYKYVFANPPEKG